MSRSGYTDDYDGEQWSMIRWRGAVASAINGKRGQSFLLEMLAAMDAMPVKKLVSHELVETEWMSCSQWGEFPYEGVCAIGSVGKRRGMDMHELDPECHENIAGKFGIADALVREIEWINDDCGSHKETPEERYARVRRWVVRQIRNVEVA